MKKFVSLSLIFLFVIYLGVAEVSATPSTTYWTTSTSDVQAYGVWHLGIDNYFTLLAEKSPTTGGKSGSLNNAPVFGLTVGVLPYEKLNMEVGVDMIEGTYFDPADGKNYPLFFNAKLGTPEGSLFEGSPALNIGMWNIGTKTDVTNYNIIHAMVGKTLPSDMGRIHVGFYSGNDKLLIDATTGKANNSGLMIGYDKWLVKDKFMFAADWATGKNAISGGGFGVYWFYTPSVSLLMGPVFPDKDSYGGKDLVWTTQMDINF